MLVSFAAAAALAMQVLPAPGAVQGWEPLVTDGSGQSFFDPASLTREGDFARLLVHLRLNAPGPEGTTSLVSRLVVNCPARTIGLEAADFYMPDGELKLSGEIPSPQRTMGPLDDAVKRAAHERACVAS